MNVTKCGDGCWSYTDDPRGLWWYWDRTAERYVCPKCWEER